MLSGISGYSYTQNSCYTGIITAQRAGGCEQAKALLKEAIMTQRGTLPKYPCTLKPQRARMMAPTSLQVF